MNNGEKIRQARLARGMTQKELGELIGVQTTTIAKYENGRVINIKRATLVKLAEVLGLNPNELIFSDTEPSYTDIISERKRRLIEYIIAVPDDKIDTIFRVVRLVMESERNG